jgi:hypothetical protein
MGLLIAEGLPGETAIDRTSAWADDRDDIALMLTLESEPYDETVPLDRWHERAEDGTDAQDVDCWPSLCCPSICCPSMCWMEVRLGGLKALFSPDTE